METLNDKDNFSKIFLKVKSNPFDEEYVSLFLEQYGSIKSSSLEFHLCYQQLRYLNQYEKIKSLNEISQIYVNLNKKSLAFMTLSESLRLTPEQDEVLLLQESLSCSLNPPTQKWSESNKCEISVIMVTFNRKDEIRTSIKSVLEQTFENFELIIINDGGLQEIDDVVCSFNSKKIRYYRLKENLGHSEALNQGILRASGRLIAYLDDDDIYYPHHLEKLYLVMSKNIDVDLVYSNAWWCEGDIRDGVFVEKSKSLNPRSPRLFDKKLLREGNYISNLTILHKRECFSGVGLFNAELNVLYDWDLLIRFSNKYKFFHINEITGEYRWKKNNISSRNRLDMVFWEEILSRFYGYYSGSFALLKGYLTQGQRERALDIMKIIAHDYSPAVATQEFQRELLALYRDLRSSNLIFYITVTRDLFLKEPLLCARLITQNRSLLLFFVILLLVPFKLSMVVCNRISGILKNRGTV